MFPAPSFMQKLLALLQWPSIASHWQVRQQKWLHQRLPLRASVRFNQKNTFIFLTRYGLLYLGLLAIVFIAGINYGNSLILLGCFILLALFIVSAAATYIQLSGLSVTALSIADTHAGAETRLLLQLDKTARRACRTLVLETGTAAIVVPCLSAGQNTLEVRLPLVFHARQKTVPPRIRISSTYPFGLMKVWSYCHFNLDVWIYPKPVDPMGLTVDGSGHTTSLTPAAGLPNRPDQGMDDLFQLVPHVPGQSLARVSWPHVARGMGLMTKYFSSNEAPDTFCLDYYQVPAISHEEKLAQLAWQISRLGEQNCRFSLTLPESQLAAGSGTTHQRAALRQLAEHR